MITFAVICNSNTICSNYINNHCIIVTAIIISFKISTAIILSADRNNNNNDNYNNYNILLKNKNTNKTSKISNVNKCVMIFTAIKIIIKQVVTSINSTNK
jgi:hypothetical protein